jgi:hypothetical protein
MTTRASAPATSLAAAALLLAATSAGGAHAEAFTADRFRPAPIGDAFAAVEAVARPAAEGERLPRLHVGIGLDYAKAPLVLREMQGGRLEAGQIVGHQAFAHVQASYVLGDRVVAWLDAPCLLDGAGDVSTASVVGAATPSGAAVGDLRLGARVRLLGAADGPFQLALSHALTLPSGDRAAYAGDGRVGFDEALAAGGLVDRRRGVWAATVGLRLRPERAMLDKRLGDEITFGAAYALLAAQRRVSFGLEAFGAAGVGAGARGVSLELLVAARARVARWTFGAAAGPGLTSAPGTPSWRLLATAGWAAF